MSENKTVSLDEFLAKAKADGQSGNTFKDTPGVVGPAMALGSVGLFS